jgi:signal transduction histidine kinase/ActR/RegA family two-component response regulator
MRAMTRGLLLVLLWALPASAAPRVQQRAVTLQLKWRHQFQFAGYYAAVEQGFFADEGLTVTVIESTPDSPPLEALKAGRVTFAVSDTDGLLARMNGAPLVVVAAIFQHSPYVLLSMKEHPVTVPADLAGRRVMDDAHQGSSEVKAMLRREGIDLGSITFVQHSWDLDDLVEGRVDAITGYRTVEPGLLRARGHEPQMLETRSYGVDFYGDALYTTQHLADADPELVRAFLRASRRGWEWAFAHVDEEAARILERPGTKERGLTLEQLRFEAHEMRDLVLPDLVEIGHMNPGRWEQIAAAYVEQGAVPKGRDWSGFLFDPEAAAQRRQRTTLQWLVGLSVLAVLGVAWTIQLRRVVARRTRELEREVAQRLDAERTLRTREAQLLQSQKLEALGQLAGGIAHDFNNLLTVVQANADLLKRKPSMAEELVPEIEQAAQRGAELVQRLLAFGRRNLLVRAPLDLGDVVDGLASMLKRLISAPVELVVERGSEPLPVVGDRALLEQVVVNLVVNARDAMMPRGGPVTVRVRRDAGHAVLEVQDRGVGMGPDTAARVFEPFFTTKPVGQGTGLGLSIAHSVAEQHGGTLTVETVLGRGSTFRLALPLAPMDARHVAASAGEGVARGRPGELVLVVEDDPPVRRVLAQALESAGWETREAGDGASALAAFDGDVRFVVSDVRMPGMSAVELVHALRARRPGVPILLVSGYAEGLHTGSDVRLPVDVPFLQKPYALEALYEAVRRGLDRAGPSPDAEAARVRTLH